MKNVLINLKRIRWWNIFFLSSFILITFVRLYKIPNLFIFGIDEEYQSLLAHSIIKDFHVIWIGLSAADTGYYVGPGLVYIHSFLLWLSKGDPVILAYVAGLNGLIVTILIYIITAKLFNIKAGTIAMLLYGFSTFMNLYDRRFWNPTFVPLIVLLMYFFYIKTWNNQYWFILIAILTGIIFHIHASLFIFFPITLLYLILYRKRKKHFISLKILLFSLVVFSLIYSPLIVYDLVHNFDNLKTPIRMFSKFSSSGNSSSLLANPILFLSTITNALFYRNDFLLRIISFSLLSISIVLLFMKKTKIEYLILLMITLSYLAFIFIYPGAILEYYFLGLIPFAFISIALILEKLPSLILIVVIALYISLNLFYFTKQSFSNGLAVKKVLVEKISQEINDKSYYLDTSGPYLYNGGWSYLFSVHGNSPATSRADEMFSWIYPEEIKNIKPDLKVIISDTQPYKSKEKPISTFHEGVYYGYIFKNL